MPQPPENNDASPQPTPAPAPSFGLPPETPIMPGTVDHHIEPSAQPTPAAAPASEPLQSKPQPIPGVIMPQHTTPQTPTPAPAPVPPPPTPAAPTVPKIPLVAIPQQKPPARTSMYDADVRGVANATPKDYGIMGSVNRTSTPPPRPQVVPQEPARLSAQDALYQSALGKPLEGPVIPSTRPQLPPTPPSPVAMSPVPAPSPAEAANEMARRTAIRTLEGDVASTIAKNQLTVGGIALAQQKKMAEEAVEGIAEEKKFSWWAVSGIILALLGVGVVTVAYLMQLNAPEPDEQVFTTQDALIPAVPEATLDITDMTRTSVLRALSELSGQYASRPGISLVRLISYREEVVESETVRVQADVSAEQFFTQISAHAPSRLIRALGKQTYFGIATVEGHALPFLAFETTSYDSSFAGMLEWEQFLLADLPFLAYTPAILPAPEPTTGTSTATSTPVSTTTPATTTPAAPSTGVPAVEIPVFVDIVVKNHDARAVKNQDGSVKLLYAFPTPTLLLIAQNEAVLSALVDHLNTARFTR